MRHLLVAVSIAVLALPALADVLNVPADFPTIQAASDAALAGDEIVVAPGVYAGFSTFVPITITGAGATGNNTIITGRISSLDGISLNMLLITGGVFTNGPSDSIADCVVLINPVELENSSVSIERTRFELCTAGTLIVMDSVATIRDCDFVNNAATLNGGAIWAQDTVLTVEDCFFMGNTAGNNGGAISADGFAADINISDCNFDNNTSNNAGAIYFNVSFGSANITRCGFDQNQSNTNASAVWMILGDDKVSPGSVSQCSFQDNTSGAQNGAAIWLSDLLLQPPAIFTSNSFCGNTTLDIRGNYADNGGNTFNTTCICLADVNHDGKVTPTDFTAWINAFNNNLPECDQNGDAVCTPTDFTAWIINFNAGCP